MLSLSPSRAPHFLNEPRSQATCRASKSQASACPGALRGGEGSGILCLKLSWRELVNHHSSVPERILGVTPRGRQIPGTLGMARGEQGRDERSGIGSNRKGGVCRWGVQKSRISATSPRPQDPSRAAAAAGMGSHSPKSGSPPMAGPALPGALAPHPWGPPLRQPELSPVSSAPPSPAPERPAGGAGAEPAVLRDAAGKVPAHREERPEGAR